MTGVERRESHPNHHNDAGPFAAISIACRFMSPFSHPPSETGVFYTRPVAWRARLACDLAAAGADGTGAGLKRPALTSTHGAVSEGRGGYSIALGTGFADSADPSQAYGVRR